VFWNRARTLARRRARTGRELLFAFPDGAFLLVVGVISGVGVVGGGVIGGGVGVGGVIVGGVGVGGVIVGGVIVGGVIVGGVIVGVVIVGVVGGVVGAGDAADRKGLSRRRG
jgi:hypothetical protein